MTEMRDEVRELFREMAEEIPRTPMLPRLDRQARVLRWRRRVVVAAAAAVVVLAAAAGAALLARNPGVTEPMPAQHPPKVFRMADVETRRPGTATLAVAAGGPMTIQNIKDGLAYVLPAAGGQAVAVPGAPSLSPGMQRLSADGTLLLRGSQGFEHITELVDLRTGTSRKYHTGDGLVQELSPDNRRIASYDARGVLITRLATGRNTTFPAAGGVRERGGLGWSPDSTRLALHEPGGTRIVDAEGTTLARIPDFSLTNSSMSWSPSGRYLLGYDEELGSLVLASADGEERTTVAKPTPTARLMGWAGPRLVWLVGAPGAQQLLTTDQQGQHPATWMRFQAGLPAVQTVTWSWALSGSPAPP
jgi:hypothetical protein